MNIPVPYRRCDRRLILSFRLIAAIIILLILSQVAAHAQVQNNNLPDCVRGFSFQVTANVITAIKDDTGQVLSVGSSKVLDNRPGNTTSSGCNLWHLTYTLNGSGLSAASIEVDTANDSLFPGSFSVWPAAQVVGTLPMTATSGVNKVVSMYGSPDYVRIFLNSATGTGTISGNLIGWRPQGTSDSTSGATQVQGAGKIGSAPTGNPVIIGFRDLNGNSQSPSPTTPLPVTVTSTTTDLATYRAAVSFSPAAVAATDIFTITGSASKTCLITHIQLSCTATAAVAADVLMVKRSTADTGGTPSAATLVPLDSTNATGTCTVNSYTANPSTGVLVGNISADKTSITTAGGAPQSLIDDFGTRETQPLILRGVGQVAAVNLNGQTITGVGCDIEIEWTEQ